MTIKVGINGFGRIGRNVLRALYEESFRQDIRIVAINDMSDVKVIAHLTKYDSICGQFKGQVKVNEGSLSVNGDQITVLCERDPSQLPWGDLGVDVVYECTGLFTDKAAAQKHLSAGAKKVLISAPAKDADATVVFGVNDHIIKPEYTIISNASCTTNCLAPLAKALHEEVGIESGMMNTIHAFTNDQPVTDVNREDLRRARAAGESMIPTKTGAAEAIGLVIPELAGKLEGLSVRVPTINVSLVDLSFISSKDTSVEAINNCLLRASVNDKKGVLAFNREPLVSIDFRHHPASCIFDSTQTRVNGRLVKVLAWYDNEWGFSNRMLDTTMAMMQAASKNQLNNVHKAG